MRRTVPRGKTGVSSRDIERGIDRCRSIAQSRWISSRWRWTRRAVFSSTGTRPPFLPSDLSLSPHLLPSFRSTFYRHSPRSILSADNASTSLRFRGGGVALLAILHRFSSKDRYFRQGVNRYRESRLRSSSSKLMQHLTSRNIFLSRGSRACDRTSFPPLSRLVSLVPSLPPIYSLLALLGVSELPIRPVFNYRVSVFVILARPKKLVRDDTWLDLPSR